MWELYRFNCLGIVREEHCSTQTLSVHRHVADLHWKGAPTAEKKGKPRVFQEEANRIVAIFLPNASN